MSDFINKLKSILKKCGVLNLNTNKQGLVDRFRQFLQDYSTVNVHSDQEREG